MVGVPHRPLPPSLPTLLVRINLHEYLAHKKQSLPRTLQQDHVSGHMVARWRVGVCYERGTPVLLRETPPETHDAGPCRGEEGEDGRFRIACKGVVKL